jgi:hypothetical protein
MRQPTKSERRSAGLYIGGLVVALIVVVVLAYAYKGSHVDSISPDAQQQQGQGTRPSP